MKYEPHVNYFIPCRNKHTGEIVSVLARWLNGRLEYDEGNFVPLAASEEPEQAQTGSKAPQERLEELKAKRVWLHGTQEEKAEYEALKESLA